MKRPEPILFDAGDTLVEYIKSNPLEGTRVLLNIAYNPDNITAEKIQAYATEIGEIFRSSRESKH